MWQSIIEGCKYNVLQEVLEEFKLFQYSISLLHNLELPKSHIKLPQWNPWWENHFYK